jgi:hypothetical protein
MSFCYVALVTLILMSQITFATIDNITSDCCANYVTWQDTYVNSGLFESGVNFSGDAEIVFGRANNILFGQTIRRAYYKLPAYCYPNLSCAILHTYVPENQVPNYCNSFQIYQQVNNLGNTTWDSLSNINWNNQPCGTIYDDLAQCNATLINEYNITECVNGYKLFDITKAVDNQCNASGLSTQLIFVAKNETYDSINWAYLFASREGYSQYGNYTKPYLEVYYNGSACGYTGAQLTGSLATTTTIIYSPLKESFFGMFVSGLADQLAIDFDSAAIIFFLFLSVIIAGMIAFRFGGKHRFEVFAIIAFSILTFFTYLGWFELWVYIILLFIAGLLLRGRFINGNAS